MFNLFREKDRRMSYDYGLLSPNRFQSDLYHFTKTCLSLFTGGFNGFGGDASGGWQNIIFKLNIKKCCG